MGLFQWVSAVSLVMMASVAWSQDPVLGQWHTIDDETGEVKSLVTLSVIEDGTLIGVITKVLTSSGDEAVCDHCKGDKKDQPIEGMQFIWGFQNTAEGEWEDGRLLDPESGDVYSGNITISDTPSELDVRGYVGFSLFGRTQTWKKVEAVKM